MRAGAGDIACCIDTPVRRCCAAAFVLLRLPPGGPRCRSTCASSWKCVSASSRWGCSWLRRCYNVGTVAPVTAVPKGSDTGLPQLAVCVVALRVPNSLPLSERTRRSNSPPMDSSALPASRAWRLRTLFPSASFRCAAGFATGEYALATDRGRQLAELTESLNAQCLGA